MAESLATRISRILASSGPRGLAARVFDRARFEAARRLAGAGEVGRRFTLAYQAAGLRGVWVQMELILLRAFGRKRSEAELIADSQRYWNDGERFGIDLKDYSHWVGSGPWSDREKWMRLGEVHFRMYQQILALSRSDVARPVVLEWGCGGGANLIHFVGEASRMVGVEISRSNLDESRRVLSEAGFERFEPVLVRADQPEEISKVARGSVDFFLSTYVFELLPSKRYGERLCRIAFDLLKPGGLGLIQIRYDDGTKRSNTKHVDYFRDSSRFTSYRIDEFWRLLEEIGFKPLSTFLVTSRTADFSGDLYAYYSFVRP